MIGNVHKIAACVGAEAHDFDANSHVLHGANRGRKVTVTRDDNGNVELWCEANKVNHEFNVKVCLEAAVAILTYILADNLIVVSREEVVKCFLVLIIWVKSGVRVCANEIAVRGDGFEQRDVVNVDSGCLCGVKDVCDVNEYCNVTTHDVCTSLSVS